MVFLVLLRKIDFFILIIFSAKAELNDLYKKSEGRTNMLLLTFKALIIMDVSLNWQPFWYIYKCSNPPLRQCKLNYGEKSLANATIDFEWIFINILFVSFHVYFEFVPEKKWWFHLTCPLQVISNCWSVRFLCFVKGSLYELKDEHEKISEENQSMVQDLQVSLTYLLDIDSVHV